MPPKHKHNKKGKGKGKGKGKQHGHHGGKSQAKHKKHPAHHGGKKDTSKQHTNHEKENPHEKQQQQLLQRKMIENIEAMYSQYTKKHESMRTFFGIMTKHNQLQSRELMNASIPNINQKITDKFLKSTQHDDRRDLNQFIFLGDVVIGAYVTELLNNDKDCLIRALCVLPYFMNYGFGSRLIVNLIKNCVKRKKLNTISLFIDEENKKGIGFFERFGFKIMKYETDGDQNKNKNKNGMKKSAPKEEKKQETDVTNVKMRLDLRIYRSSIMVLVKRELKEQKLDTK
eukprot:130210_1